jgi:ribosomal protein L29
MKVKEIRTNNSATLVKDLASMREKMRALKFKLHSQELKNPKEILKLRRDIAKTITVIKEKMAEDKNSLSNK